VAVKADAQAIYLADGRSAAQAAARAFCRRWRSAYSRMVRQLERDLPELLAFFRLPRPMVCFVNVHSVERIIYSIFQRFNLEWKTRTLRVFTQAA
jgi:transposase-like protein